MKAFLLSLSLAATLLSASEISIVKDGRPTEEALYNTSVWRCAADSLDVSGTSPGSIWFRKRIAPESFEVEATFTPVSLCSGGARLTIGKVNCGIDGRLSHDCYIDAPGQPLLQVKGSSRFLEAGRAVTLRVAGKAGKLEYWVDGNKIGDYTYSMETPLTVSLDPLRNKLAVRQFRIVRGEIAGEELHVEFPIPACRTLARCDVPQTLMLPGFPWADRRVRCSAAGLAEPEELAADVEGRLHFPAECLRKIYDAAPGLHVRAAKLSFEDPADASRRYECLVALHDPAVKAVPARGGVSFRNGHGTFTVNGEETGCTSGLLGGFLGQTAQSAASRFGASGVNGIIILCGPHEYMDAEGNFDAEGFLRKILPQMTELTARNPKAYFKLFFSLQMPASWSAAHPDEVVRLDNGKRFLANSPAHSLQPSLASTLWRRQMGKVLTQSIQALQETPFADRIPSLRLCYGNCGEWNHWGYGEGAYVDFSQPMQKAFREYLLEKYKTTEALEAAWQIPGLAEQIQSPVPNRATRQSGGFLLRANGARGLPAVDYYDFFQKLTAETIGYFAHVAKEASGGRLAVGSYYGYYLGLYDQNPLHLQDSGHYGLRWLLQNPDIDFCGGPYPYSLRNNSMIINGLAASCRLHGKLWESENDERTHHSGAGHEPYGTTRDLPETLAISRRNAMMNIDAGSIFYYYDFLGDWYRDPAYQQGIRRMRQIDHALRNIEGQDAPRLAILFSEEVIPYLTNNPRDTLLKSIAETFRTQMPCLGVPYDTYLLSDLPDIDFSRYQAVLFPNCYLADEETAAQIRRYAAGGNRTLIFLGPAGALGKDNLIHEERSAAMTGIGLKVQPEETFSTLQGKYGTASFTPTRFRCVIDDAEATIAGTWQDGAPAIGERRFPDYTSVVCGLPFLNAGILRNILSLNGLRFYNSGRSGLAQCSFSGPVLSLFSRQGGEQTIRLPREAEIVVDLFTGEVYGENVSTFRFTMPPRPSTAVIFAGRREDYRKHLTVFPHPDAVHGN